MSDIKEARAAAGRRLAAELKHHRLAQGMAVKDVMDATRMAQDVVEELESSGLTNSPVFNRVYLRSMYAGYAEAVGLASGPVLDALDAALKGVNEGLSGHPAEEATDVSPTVTVDDDDEAEEDEVPEDEEGEADDLPLPATPVDKYSPFTTASSKDPIGTGGGGVLLPNTRGLAAVVVAAVLLIALVWFAVSWLMSGPAAEDPVASADTTDVMVEPVPVPDPVVLPDTLVLYLTAVDEPLDPIRITIDRDLRRPYWIEHDSTQTFAFRNQIVLEREVENARLGLNGYEIPAHWMQDDGRFIVERDVAQAWFDSLTTQGVFPRRLQ